MNLAFSEEQRFIQDQANNFLQAQCTPFTVREVLETDKIYHQGLWQQMVDLGWPALSISEEHGGLGLGFLELCLIAEEIGKVLAPVPFLSSVVLATEAFKASSDEKLKKHWLEKLATGEVIACAALNSKHSNLEYNNGQLNGSISPVFDGAIANVAIVSAKENDQQKLFVVALDQAGINTESLQSMDPSKNIATLAFTAANAVELPFNKPLSTIIEKLLNIASVITAFEQFGCAEKTMQIGIEYTKGRYAFGRQIASFQAIKHKFADMFVALELAKSNAYYGAWALSSDAKELPLAAATARVSATDALYNISKENIEVHGGMGFTWEFDCHLYYRRAQYLSLVIGSLPTWQEKLVNALIENGIAA